MGNSASFYFQFFLSVVCVCSLATKTKQMVVKNGQSCFSRKIPPPSSTFRLRFLLFSSVS